jgi:GNAT superfamily N-acetyltransferase
VTSRYGLEIRAAAAADAPGLATLLSAAGCRADARAVAERLAALREAPGAVLLAVQWGPPSGVIALHWYPTLEEARPVAQVTTLLVGPDDRRAGIGRLLVKAAAQAARTAGCGRMELLAPEGEASLRDFCLATGFAEAGSRLVRPLRKAELRPG